MSVSNTSSIISPVFCQTCGDMLDFEVIKADKVICQRCGSGIGTKEISTYIEKTTSSYYGYKDWKNKLENISDNLNTHQNLTRAKVRQDCEKCGEKYFFFHSMQLRGADEGETVFYECINQKCGFRFSQNN